MTKDFKKPAPAVSGLGQYGMSWMLGGIAIGLLAGLAMYAIANKGEQPIAADVAASTPVSTDSGTQYAEANTTQQSDTMTDTSPAMRDASLEETSDETPGFSYHAVLPQLEVGIPITVQEEQTATAKKAAAKSKEKAETPSTKLGNANGFQLGSYKTQAQANSLQTRLKKNGLNTRVEQAEVKGEVWWRVRLGPATSPEMLTKWQQTLSGMGISAMPVRM